jgi:hypothetical protein
MGEVRNAYKILSGKLEGYSPLGRPSIDGRIILKCISEEWLGSCGLDLFSSEQGPVIWPCEYRIDPLGSIKGGVFLK